MYDILVSHGDFDNVLGIVFEAYDIGSGRFLYCKAVSLLGVWGGPEKS